VARASGSDYGGGKVVARFGKRGEGGGIETERRGRRWRERGEG
jgi:hypothetical protein